MKFLVGVLAVLFGLPAAAGLWLMSTNNGLIAKDEAVNNTYAQVQNVMQRQFELIPNLVETVKAQASSETKAFTDVAEARAKAGGVIKIDPSKIANDPVMQKQFLEAQQAMAGSLQRLLVTAEQYPNLKQSEGFKDLRTELVGSINRVSVERRRNQEAVQDWNRSIRGWPASFVANYNGYKGKPYFEAETGAARQPSVKF